MDAAGTSAAVAADARRCAPDGRRAGRGRRARVAAGGARRPARATRSADSAAMPCRPGRAAGVAGAVVQSDVPAEPAHSTRAPRTCRYADDARAAGVPTRRRARRRCRLAAPATSRPSDQPTPAPSPWPTVSPEPTQTRRPTAGVAVPKPWPSCQPTTVRPSAAPSERRPPPAAPCSREPPRRQLRPDDGAPSSSTPEKLPSTYAPSRPVALPFAAADARTFASPSARPPRARRPRRRPGSPTPCRRRQYPRAGADGDGANVRPSKTPTAPSFYPTPAPGGATKIDAGAVLELLAFVRTHAPHQNPRPCPPHPVAAALDADAERCADADAVARPVRPSDAGPDVQQATNTGADVPADASPDEVAVSLVGGGLRGLDAVQGLRELPLVRGYGREHAHQVLGGLHQPAGGPPRPRYDADARGVRLRPLRDVRHYDTCDGVWQSNATYADCVTCTEGYELDVLYDDCTGVCVPTGVALNPLLSHGSCRCFSENQAAQGISALGSGTCAPTAPSGTPTVPPTPFDGTTETTILVNASLVLEGVAEPLEINMAGPRLEALQTVLIESAALNNVVINGTRAVTKMKASSYKGATRIDYSFYTWITEEGVRE